MTNDTVFGVVLRSDDQCRIVEVIRDDLQLVSSVGSAQTLTSLFSGSSLPELVNFLLALRSQGAAFGWHLDTDLQGEPTRLHLSGVGTEEGPLILVAPTPEALQSLYEQVASHHGDSIGRFRQDLHNGRRVVTIGPSTDGSAFGRLTRIINELATLQKDLAQRNSELEAAHAEVQRLMLTDPLTGVANRRQFSSRLVEAVSRSRRHGRRLSVVMCDLDDFKKINDRFGHDVGDTVLTTFASLLRESCRREDVPARFGGDEFVILLADTGAGQAAAFADRTRQLLAAQRIAMIDQPVTVSCGVAELRDGEDGHHQVTRADHALLEAKHAGRDRTVVAR